MAEPRENLTYIDEMRGLAILMVILIHTSQRGPQWGPFVTALTGYCAAGVQLFFVASAYTMCLSFERRAHEPRRVASFYVRRFFRIAPLYYTAIAVYFLLSLYDRHAGSATAALAYRPFNVLANALFIHGFVVAANNNVVPGGWSIGTEMAFYACFPGLYFLAKGPLQGRLPRLIGLLLLALAADLALQFLILRFTSGYIQDNNFAYYNLSNQLPVFIVGIIAYFTPPQSPAPSVGAGLLGFAAFFAAVLALRIADPALGPAFTPVLNALSFVFLMGALKASKRERSLLARIGTVSYSMYIFHFIFAWRLVPKLAERLYAWLPADLVLALSFVLVAALTYALARVTERLIEARGIRLGSALVARLQGASGR